MKVYGVPVGGKNVCFNDDFTLRIPSGAVYWIGLHEDINEDSLVGYVGFPESRPSNYRDGLFDLDTDEVTVASMQIKRAATISCDQDRFVEIIREKGHSMFLNTDGENKFSSRQVLVENNTVFALRAEMKNNLMFLGTSINLTHYIALVITPSALYLGTCTKGAEFENRGDTMFRTTAVPNPRFCQSKDENKQRTLRQITLNDKYIDVNEFQIPVPEGFAATRLIEKDSHCVTIVPGKPESANFSGHDDAPVALQFQLPVTYTVYSGDLCSAEADGAIKRWLRDSINDIDSHLEQPQRISAGKDWAIYGNLRNHNTTDEIPWCVYGCYMITDQTVYAGGIVWNGIDVNPQVCSRESQKWLRSIRPIANRKEALAQVMAESSRKSFGKYAGPNGKINAIDVAGLFYKDVFFANDTDISFDGKHHHVNSIQLNSAVMDDYSFIKDHVRDFAAAICELMNFVEQNANLVLPKNHFHRNLLQVTRGQDITGATIFDLIAWHLIIIAPADKGYLVTVSTDLCNGMPGIGAFLAEFIATLRLYNGIDEDFSIDLVTMRNMDAPFMPIDRPVPGVVSISANTQIRVRKGEHPFASMARQIQDMSPVDYQAQNAQTEAMLDDEIVDLLEEHAEKAASLLEEFRMKLLNLNYGDPRMRMSYEAVEVITDLLPDDIEIPLTHMTRGFGSQQSLNIHYQVASGMYSWGPMSWTLSPDISFDITQPFNIDEKNFTRTFPQALIATLQDINKQTIYGEFIRQAGDYLARGERFVYTGSADHVISQINQMAESFDLEGTGDRDRINRIERIHVGDVVTLFHDKDNLYDRNSIDVRTSSGSIGLLSGYRASQLAPILDAGRVTLKAVVSMVTPLSARNRNAKKALVAVRITAEKKPRTPRKRATITSQPQSVRNASQNQQSATSFSGTGAASQATLQNVDSSRTERRRPKLSVQHSVSNSSTQSGQTEERVKPIAPTQTIAPVAIPESLNQFFMERSKRQKQQAIFLRINGYNEVIKEFLWKYHEIARKNGAIIDGKITNPDERQLSYYQDILGADFQLSIAFLEGKLRKWVPAMNGVARSRFADALYQELDSLQKQGKSQSILKNVYIKMMCWLYYKFEQLANNLGQTNPPKVLYAGNVTAHEFSFLKILHSLGADIVLVQRDGDAAYQKVDSVSQYSEKCSIPGLAEFPADFTLKMLRQEMSRF